MYPRPPARKISAVSASTNEGIEEEECPVQAADVQRARQVHP